jgi:hypothetical protein
MKKYLWLILILCSCNNYRYSVRQQRIHFWHLVKLEKDSGRSENDVKQAIYTYRQLRRQQRHEYRQLGAFDRNNVDYIGP